jgi:hypothetical protein
LSVLRILFFLDIQLIIVFQEEACQQPVAIFAALQVIATLPIHMIGMYVLYTKTNKLFNPSHIATKVRQKSRVKRFAGGKQ